MPLLIFSAALFCVVFYLSAPHLYGRGVVREASRIGNQQPRDRTGGNFVGTRETNVSSKEGGTLAADEVTKTRKLPPVKRKRLNF